MNESTSKPWESYESQNSVIKPKPTPEPAAYGFFLAGLVTIFAFIHRCKRHS